MRRCGISPYLLYITYINGACFAGRHCRSGFCRGPLAAARSAYDRCLAHVSPAPGQGRVRDPRGRDKMKLPERGALVGGRREEADDPPLFLYVCQAPPPPPVISPRLSPTGQQNKPPLADKNRVVTLTRSSPSPPGEGGYSRLSPPSAPPPPRRKVGTLPYLLEPRG